MWLQFTLNNQSAILQAGYFLPVKGGKNACACKKSLIRSDTAELLLSGSEWKEGKRATIRSIIDTREEQP
ncbi:hypothetical protein ACFOQM_02705 [Paenibacillus sp. GCM10012307]